MFSLHYRHVSPCKSTFRPHVHSLAPPATSVRHQFPSKYARLLGTCPCRQFNTTHDPTLYEIPTHCIIHQATILAVIIGHQGWPHPLIEFPIESAFPSNNVATFSDECPMMDNRRCLSTADSPSCRPASTVHLILVLVFPMPCTSSSSYGRLFLACRTFCPDTVFPRN